MDVDALVSAGNGFTVTVIVATLPTQFPTVEVGITRYCIVPDVVFGLVNIWLIAAPELAVAPVMPPVTVPIVHT